MLSTSRGDDCWDNMLAESLFAPLARVVVHHRARYSRSELIRELASHIDGWYNQVRRHSTPDSLSPAGSGRELLKAA